MSDIAALAYLDLMRLKNAMRTLLRSPARIVMWAVYGLWFGFMIFTRALTNSVQGATPIAGIPEPYASIVAWSFIGGAAILAGQATEGRVGAFASSADARFLTSSHLSPRTVAIWLQLRNSIGVMGRFLFVIVLYTVIFNKVGSMGGMSMTMALSAAFVASLAIPSLAAGRRIGAKVFGRLTMGVVAVTAIVLVALTAPLVAPHGTFDAISGAIVHLRLGALLDAMLSGAGLPILALALATLAMIVLAYACASDLYPELYAASLVSFARMQRRRAFGRGRSPVKYAASIPSSTRVPFSGAWTLIWKEWLGFRRGKGFVLTLCLGLLFWCGVGMSAYAFSSKGRDDSGIFGGVFFSALNIVIALSATSAVTLAADLRKPLWWLSPDAVRTRIYAWTVAAAWRLAAGIGLAMILYSALSGNYGVLSIGLPVAVIFPLALRAVSIATYAMLPAPADQRGPLAVARMLITYALVVLPLAGLLAGRYALHNWMIGAAIALVIATIQIALLVEFTAGRLSGAGASFALAEMS